MILKICFLTYKCKERRMILFQKNGVICESSNLPILMQRNEIDISGKFLEPSCGNNIRHIEIDYLLERFFYVMFSYQF